MTVRIMIAVAAFSVASALGCGSASQDAADANDASGPDARVDTRVPATDGGHADATVDSPVDQHASEASTANDAPAAASDASDSHAPDGLAHEGGGVADGNSGSDGSKDAGEDSGAIKDSGAGGAQDAGDGLITCAGARCYAGQSCVSNQCAFTQCVGTQVPGDYATLGGALFALKSIGGTICLGPQVYDAGTNAVFAPAGAAPIVIQGVSASQTTVTPFEVSDGQTLTLRGVTVAGLSAGSISDPVSLTVIASALIPPASNSTLTLGIGGPSGFGGSLSVTLDGVEITPNGSAANSRAIDLQAAENDASGSVSLTVENSYIHGFQTGFYSANLSAQMTFDVTLANNTFDLDTTGIFANGETLSSISLTYFNNIIVGSTTAVNVTWAEEGSHNALFGDTTKYAGAAVVGAGDVATDPLLDTSTSPPGLLAGSPCRGAGLATGAPAHDYWGRPRGSSIDIGAVQSSP